MTAELDDPVETRIEMNEKTVAVLRARGGNLYVWTDGAGMPRARTAPPPEPISFATTPGDGWSVHIDSTIAPPPRWVIHWTRLPWPHFRALYNPPESLRSGIDVFDVIVAWFAR